MNGWNAAMAMWKAQEVEHYGEHASKKAMKWFRLAANQGHAEAQYNLGVMYDTGDGVPQSFKEAVKWYRRAADRGYAKAQFNLGSMYIDGLGVAQSYKTAKKWLRRAADQGIPNAPRLLTALSCVNA